MRWHHIGTDYVRSECKRFVILCHHGIGWTLYDSEEFVDQFGDDLESAKSCAEQMLQVGWEEIPKSA
jgi:hypothetical protein